MNIAEATEYLANLLKEYYQTQDSDDLALPFLVQVSRIKEFRELSALDEWDDAVCCVFSDSQWADFKNRHDFDILDSVWKVGRFNLYGAINEEATRRIYTKASQTVSNIIKLPTLDSSHFDLSEW